jgi:hypothetical protein
VGITTIRNTAEEAFKFHEKESTLVLNEYSLKFNSPKIQEGVPSILEPNSKDLRSEGEKVLISLNIGMYNFYYECVPLILKAHRLYPDATIVLDNFGLHSDVDKTYYKFLEKFLNDLNIKHLIFNSRDLKYIYINNFYVLNSFLYCQDDVESVYELCKKYVKNPDVAPFRTVYVSRKKVGDRTFPNVRPGIRFNGDNRIMDEEVLEDFFIKNNVEVVYPEDMPYFIDQINYFYETKTLISLTSSGIANALFMQPNGNVFEIVTTLIQALGIPDGTLLDTREDIHHLYNALVYNKDHYYMSMPNHDRMSETIINKLKNHPTMSQFILGNKE